MTKSKKKNMLKKCPHFNRKWSSGLLLKMFLSRLERQCLLSGIAARPGTPNHCTRHLTMQVCCC